MPVKSDPARSPNPIDIHVGLQVRLRRKALKISQEKLADALGLTFQQVQKYEHGSNRVSASKLYGIAGLLECPVSWFFEGLPAPASGGGPAPADPLLPMVLTSEGLDMAMAFPQLPASIRRAFVELARAAGLGVRRT